MSRSVDNAGMAINASVFTSFVASMPALTETQVFQIDLDTSGGQIINLNVRINGTSLSADDVNSLTTGGGTWRVIPRMYILVFEDNNIKEGFENVTQTWI